MFVTDGVLQRFVGEPNARHSPRSQPDLKRQPALQPSVLREPLAAGRVALPPQHTVLGARVSRKPTKPFAPQHATGKPDIEFFQYRQQLFRAREIRHQHGLDILVYYYLVFFI